MSGSLSHNIQNSQFFLDQKYFDQCETAYNCTKTELKRLQDHFHSINIHHMDPIIKQLEILLNPKYYPFSNADVVKKTFETNGENLINGFKLLNSNYKKGILPSLTKVDHFELGRNIATSKGSVVFQNEIMQILHFTPLKKKTHEQPLLIIPPWINKYYIFDLEEKKSFIKFNLEKGIDVYVISWKNPDENDRHLTLKCYIKKGIEVALSFINKPTHILGFCLGGVATLLAGIRNTNKSIESMTLLATPIDFYKLTELQNFIQYLEMDSYKEKILKRGYQCGKDMLRMFCMLRAETMILNNMVEQYYLNKEPKPNDFLYWNMDSTNLPAVMHLEYIEKFFKKNELFNGSYRIDNKKMDIRKIDFPVFVVATEKDHIVPMEAAFALYKHNLNVRFVLGESGHIAGIINAPKQKKYGYKVYNEDGKFLYKKKYSWWGEWAKWIKPKMGKTLQTKINYQVLEEAPGSYAMFQPSLDMYK